MLTLTVTRLPLKILYAAVLTVSLIWGGLLTAYAAGSDLDTTFDTDGKVTTPIDSAHDYGRAVAVQSDGKIVAPAYQAQAAPPLEEAVPLSEDSVAEMLQFTSGGHVLGFAPDNVLVSNGTYALRVEFVQANAVTPQAPAAAGDPVQPGRPAEGDAAPALAQVTYPNLWPGISLAYDTGDGIARSTYTLEPGANPAAIRLRYNAPVQIEDDGSLSIAFETGVMRESAPLAWQEISGARIPVDITFRLVKQSGHNPNVGPNVGFSLGRYNPAYPLNIDPTLTWNTFLGESSKHDYGYGIAVDNSGNVYVVGQSGASWGSPERAYTGDDDAFAAKLGSDGSLTWNTFLGGSSGDYGYGIAVDGSGNVYVVGQSGASWGSPERAYTGGADAWAAKLGSDGSLTWNTFLGGSGSDEGRGIAVDGSGNMYVAGHSDATWGSSPVRAYTGNNDAFAAKLGSDGSLTWHTFLGGSGTDYGYGIAVDGSSNVYVAGYNYATWGSPVRAYTGNNDAFAAKLGSDGSLTWNTFLGGSSYDYGSGIAVDGSGNVYVVGYSYATWGSSPVRAYTGDYDAFAAKLGSDGSLTWNTFLGESNYDEGRGIAVDGSGNVYVTGYSEATWGSPERAYTAGYDAWAAGLAGDGSLTWNTFLGGSSGDYGYGLAVDGSGNVYVTGHSRATWGSPVRAYTNRADAFAAKLASDFAPEIDVQGNGTSITNGDTTPSTADDTDFGSITLGGTPVTHTFTISNSGTADLNLTGSPAVTVTTTHFSVTTLPSSPVINNSTTTFDITFNPSAVGNFTDTVNIANNDSDENPYTFVISGTSAGLPVNLSVSTNSGTEAAQTEVTVTTTASGNVTGDQTVDLGVSGTGITAGDYNLSNTTITILNGQSSGSVTFTVQNDTLVEGNETATLTISNPSAGLTLGATTSRDVAIADNDVQYAIAADLASVAEGDTGSTPITFTITRSGGYTDTSGTVNFSLGGTASSGSDYNNVTTSPVSFAVGKISQTITMDVLGDYVDESNETISVTLSNPAVSDNGTATLGTATAQTSITDDDTAGFTITESSGSTTVNESGTTDTFTVVLDSQPASNVELSISSGDTGEVTVSPTTLTFTASNWNTAQVITATGVDDVASDGDQNTTVTVNVIDANSDDTYDPLTDQTVTVTTVDNDIPGFTISPTSGLTTTEAGGQATFTVVLNTQPTAGVTLPVSSSDTGEGTVSSSSLSFSTLNWNVPQTVTITGVNDDVADGDTAYTIVTGDPTSTDGDYNGAGANPVDVSVTNQDNDTAGFTISTISGDTSEDGDTATFTVQLNSEPTGNVVINVVSSNTATGTVGPGQLTFTNLNWSDVQTVTVTGVDDGDNPNGNQSYTIQLTVDGSTAATEYAALDPDDVSVVNRDNDAQPIYLPLIVKGFAPGPDLVVDDVVATSSAVTVTIRNAGTTATPDAFWVDVYFDPNPAPPPINRPWDSIASYGGNWGVTATLNPGQSLVLVTGGTYYAGGSSTFPAGADVYAYVDSVNHATTTGNIQESNEGNNVFGPVISTAGSGSAVATSGGLSSLAGLPQR
jgi:hypothetical protein